MCLFGSALLLLPPLLALLRLRKELKDKKEEI